MSEQIPVAGAADANVELAGDTSAVVIEHHVTSDAKGVDKDVADIPADATADLAKNTSPTAGGPKFFLQGRQEIIKSTFFILLIS
jgi:hypothetical protein